MDEYTECVKKAVMIELELKLNTHNWKKLYIDLSRNSNKKGIPCVTNFVLALYVFFSSNRSNAPL